MDPFCSYPPSWPKSVLDNTTHSEGAAAAYCKKEKIWEGRQKLLVYLENEELLEDWPHVARSRITGALVMEWASTWNSRDEYDKIPELFWERRTKKGTDIRVRFSSKLSL